MESEASAAMTVWASFPVGRVPRPLVLFSRRVNPTGFADGAAKEAWLRRQVRVTADVPGPVTALLGDGSADPSSSVVLDRAERIDHPFRTDRGEVPLPAWRLHGPSLHRGGCVVLDPGVETWWALDDHPEVASVAGRDAVVDSTGTRVRWQAFGPPRARFLGVEFEEHRTHVVGRAVLGRARPGTGPGTDGMTVRSQVVEGTLREPLGPRVLVDEHGAPVSVWPSG